MSKECDFKVGDRVQWTGHLGHHFECPVMRITEPQPGIFVLWCNLFENGEYGSTQHDWFPITSSEVSKVEQAQ